MPLSEALILKQYDVLKEAVGETSGIDLDAVKEKVKAFDVEVPVVVLPGGER